MPLQDYQVGSTDLNSAVFQRRYEPNFAWGNVMSHMLQIPYQRALWNFASRDENNQFLDLSGQGRILTNTNSYATNLSGLAPYVDMAAGGGIRRADEAGLDLTSYMTIGGWFWMDSIASSRGFLTKWVDAGDQRSYILYFDQATGKPYFYISTNGQAGGIFGIAHTTSLAASRWYHVCGQLVSSTEASIYVDAEQVKTSVAVPASAFNGTAPFEIGGWNVSTAGLLDGRAAYCFLSAAYLPPYWIRSLYELSRPIFGV